MNRGTLREFNEGVEMMKHNAFIVRTILSLISLTILLTVPVTADSVITIGNITSFESPYGTIIINAKCPDEIISVPVFHGTVSENCLIDQQFQQIGKERQNVTTISEAKAATEKALEPYGGLPESAVFDGASITYSEIFDHTLHMTKYKAPMFTTVSYSHQINGFWVIGDSNCIILTLGTVGEFLRLSKVWRDYTYIQDVDIISVFFAI